MKITEIENRGTAERPFGFVYFDDNSRVLYGANLGVHPFVGPYWRPAMASHVTAAKARLALEFPGIDFTDTRAVAAT